MLRQPLLYWLPKHPVFWFTFINLPNTVSSATYGYLPLTVQPLCNLRDVMPCHWSPGASQPRLLTSSLALPWAIARFLDPFYTFRPAHPFDRECYGFERERFSLSGVFYLLLLIPTEAEDFPRGDRHFKHVPPLTYLIYLSLRELYR